MKTLGSLGLALATFVVASFAARAADAHISLTYPPSRYDDQKSGPCGRGSSDARTKKVSTFKPGQKITVAWDETVSHPGHYRISFDPDGQSGFVDPETADERNSAPTVLVDGIKDKTGTQSYTQEITLPDAPCDKCTLQLIQVMTDKPPYGDGNDLYYQCADIVLDPNATAPAEDGGTSSGGTSSGETSSGGTSSGDTTSGTTTTPASSDDGGCATAGSSASIAGVTPIALALATVLVRRRKRTPSPRR